MYIKQSHNIFFSLDKFKSKSSSLGQLKWFMKFYSFSDDGVMLYFVMFMF